MESLPLWLFAANGGNDTTQRILANGYAPSDATEEYLSNLHNFVRKEHANQSYAFFADSLYYRFLREVEKFMTEDPSQGSTGNNFKNTKEAQEARQKFLEEWKAVCVKEEADGMLADEAAASQDVHNGDHNVDVPNLKERGIAAAFVVRFIDTLLEGDFVRHGSVLNFTADIGLSDMYEDDDKSEASASSRTLKVEGGRLQLMLNMLPLQGPGWEKKPQSTGQPENDPIPDLRPRPLTQTIWAKKELELAKLAWANHGFAGGKGFEYRAKRYFDPVLAKEKDYDADGVESESGEGAGENSEDKNFSQIDLKSRPWNSARTMRIALREEFENPVGNDPSPEEDSAEGGFSTSQERLDLQHRYYATYEADAFSKLKKIIRFSPGCKRAETSADVRRKMYGALDGIGIWWTKMGKLEEKYQKLSRQAESSSAISAGRQGSGQQDNDRLWKQQQQETAKAFISAMASRRKEMVRIPGERSVHNVGDSEENSKVRDREGESNTGEETSESWIAKEASGILDLQKDFPALQRDPTPNPTAKGESSKLHGYLGFSDGLGDLAAVGGNVSTAGGDGDVNTNPANTNSVNLQLLKLWISENPNEGSVADEDALNAKRELFKEFLAHSQNKNSGGMNGFDNHSNGNDAAKEYDNFGHLPDPDPSELFAAKKSLESMLKQGGDVSLFPGLQKEEDKEQLALQFAKRKKALSRLIPVEKLDETLKEWDEHPEKFKLFEKEAIFAQRMDNLVLKRDPDTAAYDEESKIGTLANDLTDRGEAKANFEEDRGGSSTSKVDKSVDKSKTHEDSSADAASDEKNPFIAHPEALTNDVQRDWASFWGDFGHRYGETALKSWMPLWESQNPEMANFIKPHIIWPVDGTSFDGGNHNLQASTQGGRTNSFGHRTSGRKSYSTPESRRIRNEIMKQIRKENGTGGLWWEKDNDYFKKEMMEVR